MVGLVIREVSKRIDINQINDFVPPYIIFILLAMHSIAIKVIIFIKSIKKQK